MFKTYKAIKIEHFVSVIDNLAILLGQPPCPKADPGGEWWENASDEEEELCDMVAKDVVD